MSNSTIGYITRTRRLELFIKLEPTIVYCVVYKRYSIEAQHAQTHTHTHTNVAMCDGNTPHYLH